MMRSLLLVAVALPFVWACSAAGGSAASSGVTDNPVRTTGCGRTAGGATLTRQLAVNGLQRRYLVHLPAGVSPRAVLPVVLYFHGGGRVPADMLGVENAESGFSQLADRDGFMAVYPLGNTRPLDGRTGWNTGNAQLVTYNPRADDVLFVSRLLDDLQSVTCVDSRRIYATGFSSGASMADLLACRLAGRIAAFAPVEGAYFPVPGGCRPARAVPLISFQGTGDDKVPYYAGEQTGIGAGMEPIPQWLSGWARLDGCHLASITFFSQADVTGQQWTGCANGAALVHYRIAGGQHAWPGGVSWPGAPGGTPTIDASSLIWSFVSSHRMA